MNFHFFVSLDESFCSFLIILKCEKNIIEIIIYKSVILIIISGNHIRGLIWGIQEYLMCKYF